MTTIKDREIFETFLKHFHRPDADGRPLADRELRFIKLNQLSQLIDLELATRNSRSVLRRLHSRLSRLRTQREREALLRGESGWKVNHKENL